MADQNGESGASPHLAWLKVLEPDELGDGRVKPVTCEHTTVCMTRLGGKYTALDNKCPHHSDRPCTSSWRIRNLPGRAAP